MNNICVIQFIPIISDPIRKKVERISDHPMRYSKSRGLTLSEYTTLFLSLISNFFTMIHYCKFFYWFFLLGVWWKRKRIYCRSRTERKHDNRLLANDMGARRSNYRDGHLTQWRRQGKEKEQYVKTYILYFRWFFNRFLHCI